MARHRSSVGPRHLVAGAVVLAALVTGVVVGATSDSESGDPPRTTPTATTTPGDPGGPATGACASLLASPPVPGPGRDLALTGANVVTMDADFRASGITIAGGQIQALSAPGSGAVDLEGATVLPGLIDSHSHWIGDKDVAGQTAAQAIDEALSQGWTSISELFVDEDELEELCGLEQAGDLPLKVGAFLPLNYGRERFGRPYEAYQPGQSLGPTLFLQGVKVFADRAEDGLGFQTDPPSEAVQGTLFWEPKELRDEIEAAHEAGWQVAVHATGDGGLDAALDALEPLGGAAILAARHRIEHLTVVRDDQIRRLVELGLIASIQLSWHHSDTADTLTRWVGQDRVSLTGRWRDLVGAGVTITGGTDRPWAVEGEVGGSIEAISQAVTRVGPSGRQPPAWMRSQRLTVDEVLRSLTIGAAFAQRREQYVGSLAVGKAGDLVILSADPTRVRAAKLADIQVLATVVDGTVEFCSESAPEALRPLCPA